MKNQLKDQIKNQINFIPGQGEIRDMLRREARLFVSANKIEPPVDFKTLEQQAKNLLIHLNLDNQYLEFAIVVTANEIWSEVVSATPFNRRLLLLPQCLRDTSNCRAVFDDMGLVCAGCNNCGINGILDESESLGYTTLVADGTSIAISLVEEGSIDAVIGVGCMQVLKQSFRPVNHVAVPAIALPLMHDGCDGTTLDYKWLSEEIRRYKFNPRISPLSISTLKNKVRDYFTEETLRRFFPEDTEVERLACKVVRTGGQRMRPLLLLLAYQCYNEHDTEEMYSALAVIIECFHKASLVHDDIEDRSDTRYGQPALHTAEGIPVAMNVGDYLIGKGYNLLSRLQCEPGLLAGCFRLVSESHLKMAEGQGADIQLSEKISGYSAADLLHIYKLKTGEAVKVAMLLGAVLGNAAEKEIQYLNDFSEWFGAAYQVRDDLMEYRENKEPDHPMEYPFLLVLLNEEMKGRCTLLNGTSGLTLDGLSAGLSSNGFANNLKNSLLRQRISELRIEQKAEDYLNDCIKKCYIELDKLQNYKLRLSLYGVIGKVFKEYNI